MSKKHIGVTVIFYKKNNNLYEAVKSSYIIENASNFDIFKIKLSFKVKELLNFNFKGYKFLGVNDIYISEKEGENNFLGRSSFYEYNSLEKSKEFILKENELEVALIKSTEFKKKNISYVYFNKDLEGKEFYSTIIIYSQTKGNVDLNGLLSIATSKLFKEKILRYSIEKLNENDLIFVGIADLYEIKNSGLFEQKLDVKSIIELEDEIIIEENIEQAFNDVIKDYEYVS
tara:strand:- start:9159 stop:9848 length:690 start_codon:yes stop_codon:yes gene_type:complete